MDKNAFPRYLVVLLAMYMNNGIAENMDSLSKRVAKLQQLLDTNFLSSTYRVSEESMFRRELLEDVERLVAHGYAVKIPRGNSHILVLTPQGVNFVENAIPRNFVEDLKHRLSNDEVSNVRSDVHTSTEVRNFTVNVNGVHGAIAKEVALNISKILDTLVDQLRRSLRSCSTTYCVAMKLETFYTYLKEMNMDLGLKLSTRDVLRIALSDDGVLEIVSRIVGIGTLPQLIRERVQFKNLREVVDVIEDWLSKEFDDYLKRLEKVRRVKRVAKRRFFKPHILRAPANENKVVVKTIEPKESRKESEIEEVGEKKKELEQKAEEKTTEEVSEGRSRGSIAKWVLLAISLAALTISIMLLLGIPP